MERDQSDDNLTASEEAEAEAIARRRAFLRLAGLGLGGVALAGCAEPAGLAGSSQNLTWVDVDGDADVPQTDSGQAPLCVDKATPYVMVTDAANWMGLDPSDPLLDWADIIEEAVDNLSTSGGTVLFPMLCQSGLNYKIRRTVVIDKPGVRLVGAGSGRWGAVPGITWEPYSTEQSAIEPQVLGPMIKVVAGNPGFSCERLVFNCADLATVGLHVEATTTISTHDIYLSELTFSGYTREGLLLGDASVPYSGAQMRVVTAKALVFLGGSPGFNQIKGVRINAQNAEFVNFEAPYFDPPSDSTQLNHIHLESGGISVTAMASTRSGGYAIEAEGNHVVLNGWRTEDKHLIRWGRAAAPNSGCQISGISHRTGVTTTDWHRGVAAIDIKSLAGEHSTNVGDRGSTFVFTGCRILQSIGVRAHNAHMLTLNGVKFGRLNDGTRGYVIQYSGGSPLSNPGGHCRLPGRVVWQLSELERVGVGYPQKHFVRLGGARIYETDSASEIHRFVDYDNTNGGALGLGIGEEFVLLCKHPLELHFQGSNIPSNIYAPQSTSYVAAVGEKLSFVFDGTLWWASGGDISRAIWGGTYSLTGTSAENIPHFLPYTPSVEKVSILQQRGLNVVEVVSADATNIRVQQNTNVTTSFTWRVYA